VNVLALPGAAPIADLAAAGVRRVSTGSLLASRAYGALVAGAEALRNGRDASYAEGGVSGDALRDAFGV
jgi:2-methylisocitrate lyase-like PEP mutase family enzyme